MFLRSCFLYWIGYDRQILDILRGEEKDLDLILLHLVQNESSDSFEKVIERIPSDFIRIENK